MISSSIYGGQGNDSMLDKSIAAASTAIMVLTPSTVISPQRWFMETMLARLVPTPLVLIPPQALPSMAAAATILSSLEATQLPLAPFTVALVQTAFGLRYCYEFSYRW